MTKQRIRRIFGKAGLAGITPDSILFANSAGEEQNFFYSTGIGGGVFEASYCAVFPDGGGTAIVPALERAIAERELPPNINLECYSDNSGFEAALKKALAGKKSIGLNFDYLKMGAYRRITGLLGPRKFADVSEAVRAARLVKEPAEISLIREACRISEEALSAVLEGRGVRKGTTETQLAARLDYEMSSRGGQPAFHTIVAFGANSAEPHHTPGNRRLKAGDIVLADFGARRKRYCSDTTRVMSCGRPGARIREMHEAVLEARRRALGAATPGGDAAAVHDAARDAIDARGFTGKFIHSTGHALGLEVHDGPGFSSHHFRLEKGMVFTVEPGIYVRGTGGIRIEDDIVIGGPKPRILTRFPREIIEI
ncbi:MAG: Xaa-Pro peptidase family protein [Candidatus Micrarchaeota archaeon]